MTRRRDLAPVTDWLLHEGRFADDLSTLADGLAQQLVIAGVSLWRLRLGIRTLHPLIAALSGAWERDGGVIPVPKAQHGLETRSTYIGSPLAIIQQTGEPFRRDLRQPLGPDDHTVLKELKDRGATDYFGLPMRFSTNPGGLMVLVTDHPDGFDDHDIAMFTDLAKALAPVAEVIRLKHATHAITAAYLGPRSAERVLSGQITRGHVEKIRAAILFSDIRGWTALSAAQEPEETVAIANRYFEVMEQAITAQGGEILKLMGDGILAIFPDDDAKGAVTAALSAAQAAHEAAKNADPPLGIRFSTAMHVGDVLYGNIGSEARLDFTVLGPAVNLAARLDSLCSTYDRHILFSEEFATQLSQRTEKLGMERIKGLDVPQAVYSLPLT